MGECPVPQTSLVLTVYGADKPCPSCLHAPSSKETMEWVEAAVLRKFAGSDIAVRYVDIDHSEMATEEDQHFSEHIQAESYFYPLVVVNGQVVGEGNPKLKQIFQAIEACGYSPAM